MKKVYLILQDGHVIHHFDTRKAAYLGVRLCKREDDKEGVSHKYTVFAAHLWSAYDIRIMLDIND